MLPDDITIAASLTPRCLGSYDTAYTERYAEHSPSHLQQIGYKSVLKVGQIHGHAAGHEERV